MCVCVCVCVFINMRTEMERNNAHTYTDIGDGQLGCVVGSLFFPCRSLLPLYLVTFDTDTQLGCCPRVFVSHVCVCVCVCARARVCVILYV